MKYKWAKYRFALFLIPYGFLGAAFLFNELSGRATYVFEILFLSSLFPFTVAGLIMRTKYMQRVLKLEGEKVEWKVHAVTLLGFFGIVIGLLGWVLLYIWVSGNLDV
jgi:hypothetical protein